MATVQLIICTAHWSAMPLDRGNLNTIEQRLEPKLVDWWFNIRKDLTPPAKLMVITVDDLSTQKLNVSRLQAWPRELHARLLNTLAEAGARLVFFDFFFKESRSPEGDAALAAALKLLPTIIVKTGSMAKSGRMSRVPVVLEPLDSFKEAAAAVLPAENPLDIDGTARRFNTQDLGAPGGIPLAKGLALVEEVKEPLPGPRDFVNYYGEPGTIPTIPYFRALESSAADAKKLFKDKYIFVGQNFLLGQNTFSSSPGTALLDTFSVPVSSERMTGVEIHATMAGNIMEKSWIWRFSLVKEGLGLVIAAFLISMAIFSVRPLWGGIILLSSFVLWATSSYTAFCYHYFIPGVSLFGITLPLTYFSSTWHSYLKARKSYLNIEAALGISLEGKR